MSKTKNKRKKKGNGWLQKELSAYRPLVLFLSFLSVCIALLSVSFAYLIQYLIKAASDKNEKKLFFFIAVVFVVLILRIAIQMLNSYQSEKCRTKISVNLRQKIFGNLLYADYSQTNRIHSGDLMSRLTFDVTEVATDTTTLLPSTAGCIVRGIGAFFALCSIEPFFTTIYALGVIIMGIIGIFLRKKTKRYHKEVSEAESNSRAFMQESLGSVVTLKAYCAEEQTKETAALRLNEYYDKRLKKARFQTWLGGGFSFLSGVGLLFAVVWCGTGIVGGTVDYGKTLSVVLLLGQLQQPLTAVSSLLSVYYARAASGERLSEVDSFLEEEHENETVFKTESADSFHRVVAQGITFGYEKEQVLQNADAEFRKGEIVCITGESGTGKTTFLRLLLNIYKPDNGGFFIETEADDGNINIRPLTVKDRSLFAYVPQKNFLFSGTIRQNLALFSPKEEISEEKLREALNVAEATFVYELPQGLDTYLRESGSGLSEGQLQRLAVARALLSCRPVLLFDEVTSALDEETEKKMLKNLKRLRDKTCLIVTHRPEALNIADSVFQIKDGKIQTAEKNNKV